MVDNKNNYFLKVFIFTLVILAIQCFNESFSASVQKSSGNGAKVTSRLLMDDLDASTLTIALAGETEGSSNNLATDGTESQVDEMGSVGNISICSTIDGDVQAPAEDASGKKRKLSKEKVYGSNLMGETTMADMEYEQKFMRDCRNKKGSGIFQKRLVRSLKKYNYLAPVVMIALLAGMMFKSWGAIMVVMALYAVFLVVIYIRKKVE